MLSCCLAVHWPPEPRSGCKRGLKPCYLFCSQRRGGLESRKQTHKYTRGQYLLLPQTKDRGAPGSTPTSTLLPILSNQVFLLPHPPWVLALDSDSLSLPSPFTLMTGRSGLASFPLGCFLRSCGLSSYPSIPPSSSLWGPAPLSRAQCRPQPPVL